MHFASTGMIRQTVIFNQSHRGSICGSMTIGRQATLYEDLNTYVNEKETFITEEDKEFFVALNQYYKDRFGVMFDFIFYGQERFDEKKMTDKQDPNSYFKNSMGTYVPGILNDEGILKYKEIVKGTI